MFRLVLYTLTFLLLTTDSFSAVVRTGGGGSSSSVNVGVGTTNRFAGYVGISTIGAFQTVEVGGNIGIGSLSPTTKLDVNGTSRSTQFISVTTNTPNIVYNSNTGTNTLDSSFWVGVSGNGDNTNNDPFQVGLGTTNATPKITILTSSGNFGIATSSPANNFSVLGNASFGSYATTSAPTGGIIISGNVGIGTSSPQTVLVSMGNVGIGTWTAAGGNLIVNGGGNVGIGSAWPGVSLDIQGGIRIKPGTSAGSSAKVGGMIFDHYVDSTVGGTEADIYTDTLLANTFGSNGDKVIASYSGNFVTLGTESTQLKAYFAGTGIWDSTGIAPSSGTSSWRIYVELIRVSSTVVRYTVALNTTGASGFVYAISGELTGLTLSGTNIIKITGTSSGVGSGSGDIVGKMGYVEFDPAS